MRVGASDTSLACNFGNYVSSRLAYFIGTCQFAYFKIFSFTCALLYLGPVVAFLFLLFVLPKKKVKNHAYVICYCTYSHIWFGYNLFHTI